MARFEGRHIKREDTKTLIVVFHGAFTSFNAAYISKIYKGIIEEEKVKKIHEYANYTSSLSTIFSHTDFLYLEDYYNKLYGWYMFDEGQFIYEEISKKLSQFIEKNGYEHVIVMGSSKGGTGALLAGLHCPLVDDVFCMVPDLKVSVDNLGIEAREYIFMKNKELEPQLKTIFTRDTLFDLLAQKKKPTHFHFLTGARDYGLKDLSQFILKLGNNPHLSWNTYFIVRPEGHNEIVQNHMAIVYDILDHLLVKSDKLDPHLYTQIDLHTYIITYKGLSLTSGEWLKLHR